MDIKTFEKEVRERSDYGYHLTLINQEVIDNPHIYQVELDVEAINDTLVYDMLIEGLGYEIIRNLKPIKTVKAKVLWTNPNVNLVNDLKRAEVTTYRLVLYPLKLYSYLREPQKWRGLDEPIEPEDKQECIEWVGVNSLNYLRQAILLNPTIKVNYTLEITDKVVTLKTKIDPIDCNIITGVL